MYEVLSISKYKSQCQLFAKTLTVITLAKHLQTIINYKKKILVEIQKGIQSPWYPYLNSLPRYYTNAASMTPFCCLCLPSLMRKLAVRERGNMSRLSVSSIKLIPYLNDDVKYDVELCNWVYQVVYTRSVETVDGDLKLIPMGDVSICVYYYDCY